VSFWSNPYQSNVRRRRRRKNTVTQARSRELRRGCSVTYRPLPGGEVALISSCRRKRIANQDRYFVYEMSRGKLSHELGPYDLQTARLYGRISATEGKHDRVVTRGRDGPIVRRYEAGTGESVM